MEKLGFFFSFAPEGERIPPHAYHCNFKLNSVKGRRTHERTMNDRLGEITPSWAIEPTATLGSDPGPSNSTPPSSTTSPMEIEVDLEGQTTAADSLVSNSAPSKFMSTFFQDVDEIKASIMQIKSSSKRISELNEEAVMASSMEKEKEVSSILSPLVMETNKRAKGAKTLLGALKDENEKMKKR